VTQIIRTLAALRRQVADWHRAGERVALVPTMGALHAGHLSLVAAAKAGADRVIVSIFVNPKQFNNPDDLAKYPRTEQADALLLAPLGVDLIFVPDAADVYPDGFATTVIVSGISAGLDGTFRPGHFEGVATVVCKLFTMTAADCAFFGEKDYQQLLVVRRMVRDLNLTVEVVGCPTLRDPDGLAMSSRNTRLGAAARAIAPVLPAAMQEAVAAMRAGTAPDAALDAARTKVLAAGFSAVDYLCLCSAETLEPLAHLDHPARLLAAAWLDGVRLIDNIAV
jgi:pantoate--beta-alanine ligase